MKKISQKGAWPSKRFHNPECPWYIEDMILTCVESIQVKISEEKINANHLSWIWKLLLS